jgi:hypothetical protein
VNFASERSEHKFLGATQVRLDQFTGNGSTQANLTLDKNDVTYSDAFGDIVTTEVAYQPSTVTLERLRLADPTGQDRRIYSVRFPAGDSTLGQHTMRLVWPASNNDNPRRVRLVLVDSHDKVVHTIALLPK